MSNIIKNFFIKINNMKKCINLIENQIELIYVFKPNGTITFMNKAFRDYFNISEGQNIPRTRELQIYNVFSESLKKLNINNFLTVIKTNFGIFNYNKIRECWFKWTIRAIYNKNNKLVEYQAIGVNITDQKKVELSLIESNSRLQLFLNAMPIGVYIVDAWGNPLFVNDKANEILENNIYINIHIKNFNSLYGAYIPDSNTLYPKENMPLFKALKGEESYIDNIEIRVNGSIKPLEIWGKPIFDDDGIINYAIAIFSDITKRKQNLKNLKETMDKLEKSNTELENFASIVSHDLRNPLSSIIGYFNYINRNYKDKIGEEGLKLNSEFKESAGRMVEMIESLLDYSHINKNINKRFKKCNSEHILKYALANLSDDIEKTNAKIIYDENLPIVFGDEIHLIRVFQNIISNSIKYSKKDENPIIHISTLDGNSKNIDNINYDDMVIFSIKDNGIGIDDKYKDRVFQIFQRINKYDNNGTGIGLSSVKKIIEYHNGTIWFDSIPNEGTSFYFTLNKYVSENK